MLEYTPKKAAPMRRQDAAVGGRQRREHAARRRRRALREAHHASTRARPRSASCRARTGAPRQLRKRTSHITVVVDERRSGEEAEHGTESTSEGLPPRRHRELGLAAGSRGATIASSCTRTSSSASSSRSASTTPASRRSRSSAPPTRRRSTSTPRGPGIVIGKKGAEIEKLKQRARASSRARRPSSTSTRCGGPISTRSWWPRTSRCSSSAASRSAAP